MNANPNVRPGVVTGRFGGASPVALMLGGFVLLLSVLWVRAGCPERDQLNLNTGLGSRDCVAVCAGWCRGGAATAAQRDRLDLPGRCGAVDRRGRCQVAISSSATGSAITGCRSGLQRCCSAWSGRSRRSCCRSGSCSFPDGRLRPWRRRWRPALYAYLLLATCWPVGVAVVAAGAISGHHLRVDAGGNVTAVNPIRREVRPGSAVSRRSSSH